jgi:energy-coupling factor transport system permease protein
MLPWSVTLESVVFSVAMSFRLLAVVSAFAVLTLTVNPDDMLQMFLLLRFPYRTVLTTSIASRFVPCLLTDVDLIQNSLRTRGYRLDEGGFLGRIKKRAVLIPPLLSNSLERSIQSAEAMEARGFGSKGKKTFYKSIPTTRVDYFFISLPLSLFLMFMTMWVLGIGTYDYYPVLSPVAATFPYVGVAVFIVFLTTAPVVFSPLKRVMVLD